MVSLIEALKKKFEDLGCDIPGIAIAGSPGKTGSGRLYLPYILIMDGQGIRTAGTANKLDELAGEVVELDLSDNLFEAWSEVVQILQCLPSLTSLNLCHNPLHKATDVDSLCNVGPFPNITTLALNGIKADWTHVIQLLTLLPNLEALYLCLNGYSEVAPNLPLHAPLEPASDNAFSQGFPSVRQLFYNQNGLNSWDQVVRLGRLFPRVGTLIMLENGLTEIPSDTRWTEVFKELVHLNLSGNHIDDWESLDSLRALARLEELRVAGMPLAKDWPGEQVRAHAIARLPGVQRLNGSDVTAEERDVAERMFIRRQMELPEDERGDRYFELEQKHGKLQPLADVDLSPRDCAHVLVRYESDSRPYTLNLRRSVGEVKKELCTLFTLGKSVGVRMFYIDREVEGIGPDEMKYLGRSIHSYRPADGDEFILQLK